MSAEQAEQTLMQLWQQVAGQVDSGMEPGLVLSSRLLVAIRDHVRATADIRVELAETKRELEMWKQGQGSLPL